MISVCARNRRADAHPASASERVSQSEDIVGVRVHDTRAFRGREFASCLFPVMNYNARAGPRRQHTRGTEIDEVDSSRGNMKATVRASIVGKDDVGAREVLERAFRGSVDEPRRCGTHDKRHVVVVQELHPLEAQAARVSAECAPSVRITHLYDPV